MKTPAPSRVRVRILLAVGIATISLRAQDERASIAALQSDAPIYVRAQACRELALRGSEYSVPALAAVLADKALSHYAREALEVMPFPAAGAALRAALPTLKGDLLVGVINSIAMRRDRDAIAALVSLANAADAQGASAALVALGRIGGNEAAAAVENALASARDGRRDAAAEACLLLAGRQLADGQREAAQRTYDLTRLAPVSAPWRVSATRGAILARGAAGSALLIEQLHSSDEGMQDVLLVTIRDAPDPHLSDALLKELQKFDPMMQARVITALVDREGAKLTAVIQAKTTDASEEVRTVAIAALGRIGGSASLPLLLQAARRPAERESAAALASLGRIKAPETQSEILKSLPSADAGLRAKLIAVIAERNEAGAAAELLKLAESSELEVSKASLRALAIAAQPEDLPALTRLTAVMAQEEQRTLAAQAVAAVASRIPDAERRIDPVLTGIRDSTTADARASLLLALGLVVRTGGGNANALALVSSALKDDSDRVRSAALRVLSDWADASAAKPLLEFAARGDATPAQKDIALHGAVRLAENAAAGRNRSPVDALAIFQQIAQVVRTRDEKVLLVSSLPRLKRIEVVAILQNYLADPEVHAAAAAAVVQLAPALLDSENGASVRQLLQRIAAEDTDATIRKQAADAANRPRKPKPR